MTTPPTSVTPIKISPVDETDAGLWRLMLSIDHVAWRGVPGAEDGAIALSLLAEPNPNS